MSRVLVTLGISGTNSSNPARRHHRGGWWAASRSSEASSWVCRVKYVLNATMVWTTPLALSNEFEITGLHCVRKAAGAKKRRELSAATYMVVWRTPETGSSKQLASGSVDLNTSRTVLNAACPIARTVFSLASPTAPPGFRSINSLGEYTITFYRERTENRDGYTIDHYRQSIQAVVADHLQFVQKPLTYGCGHSA